MARRAPQVNPELRVVAEMAAKAQRHVGGDRARRGRQRSPRERGAVVGGEARDLAKRIA
jgi:hypothetical protein